MSAREDALSTRSFRNEGHRDGNILKTPAEKNKSESDIVKIHRLKGHSYKWEQIYLREISQRMTELQDSFREYLVEERGPVS